MKVKVGDKIYDSETEPVMVILSKEDKENISSMDPKANSYCVYPDGERWTKNDHEKIKGFMEIRKIDKNFPEKEKEQTIATLEDWYAKLDKPCKSMRTDFGEPRCAKQFSCFILNDSFTCPEGRILKEKEDGRKEDMGCNIT